MSGRPKVRGRGRGRGRGRQQVAHHHLGGSVLTERAGLVRG